MRFFLFFIFSISAFAYAQVCNSDHQFCSDDHHSSSSTNDTRPTSSSSVNFNPSTVPLSRGLGVELIYFKGIDASLVTGTGRIGAALSPMNTDETFFGAPAFEDSNAFLEREVDQTKYPSQKFTLATAFNIFESQSGGLGKSALNIGVMAKYNFISNSINPGGGISGLWGPINFAYAYYLDESNIDLGLYYPGAFEKVSYQVQTYSLGLSLGSLSLDYSVLNLVATNAQVTDSATLVYVDLSPAIVSLATATLFYQKGIFTLAARQEDSNRPAYDTQAHTLVYQRIKNDVFGSIQYIAGKHFFLGAFYNYYLLREVSVGLTVFF